MNNSSAEYLILGPGDGLPIIIKQIKPYSYIYLKCWSRTCIASYRYVISSMLLIHSYSYSEVSPMQSDTPQLLTVASPHLLCLFAVICRNLMIATS